MKKIISLLLIMLLSVGLFACGKQPTEEQLGLKKINELATYDCYYHTVTKVEHEDAKRIFFFWTQDLEFWMECEGVVTLGVDTELLDVDINGEKVKITLPPTKVLACDVKDIDEDAIIVAKDSVKPKFDDQKEAIAQAEKEIKKEAEKDKTLMEQAEERAKLLIENYIKGVGEEFGIDYEIQWKLVDENGKKR